MLIKPSDFRLEVYNSQPCIAAHLQGTQSKHTEPNLSKELQLPKHGNQFSIQTIPQRLYNKIVRYINLKEHKSKQKNKGLRPLFFPFADSILRSNLKLTLLPLCGIANLK